MMPQQKEMAVAVAARGRSSFKVLGRERGEENDEGEQGRRRAKGWREWAVGVPECGEETLEGTADRRI